MSSGIKKQYLKTNEACKVRFRLPENAVNGEEKVCIVGDFNNWNPSANPMQKLKSGDYTITLTLKSGKEYQYKYLIGGTKWENDWNADRYVRSPYGDSDNSVVIT
ncbi:MAG: isoamylase early set domain-containing protein [Desulfobacterales bacterium]|nr:isoamylase early set domain-containing protein [Desulfobacterales bacterium]